MKNDFGASKKKTINNVDKQGEGAHPKVNNISKAYGSNLSTNLKPQNPGQCSSWMYLIVDIFRSMY